MVAIAVFDPPMCCATGVCGPSVDPALAQFAADLAWLRENGVAVERHNLAQEPAAFVSHEAVRDALQARGEACLPLVLVDGAIVSEGRYPNRVELAEWAGLPPPDPASIPAAPPAAGLVSLSEKLPG